MMQWNGANGVTERESHLSLMCGMVDVTNTVTFIGELSDIPVNQHYRIISTMHHNSTEKQIVWIKCVHYTSNTSSSIGATTSPYILIYIMKKLCSYELRTEESQSHKRRKDNQGMTRILMCFQNRCRYYTFSCLLYFFFSFLNPTTANTIVSSSSWSLDLSACSNSVKKSNNILDIWESVG